MDDERTLAELSEQPLDDVDVAHLQELRALFDAVDPVPADLVSRVGFALALDEVFDEVARMTRVPLDALAVRSEQSVTRTETLTFSAERLTAMVTVSRGATGRLRLDGWIAPADPCRVQLRIQEDGVEHEQDVDPDGRFGFQDLPDGFAQLVFRSTAGGDDPRMVVTPVFQL